MDHGNVAILTAYCARGSLEDVLANEDLHLDNMFVSSLVSDILKVKEQEVTIGVHLSHFSEFIHNFYASFGPFLCPKTSKTAFFLAKPFFRTGNDLSS